MQRQNIGDMTEMDSLKAKAAELPEKPGVCFFKNAAAPAALQGSSAR